MSNANLSKDEGGISRLIRALEIFRKYGDPPYPTHCEHDTLGVCCDPDVVTDEDKAELDRLGFHVDEGGFRSYRFGSC